MNTDYGLLTRLCGDVVFDHLMYVSCHITILMLSYMITCVLCAKLIHVKEAMHKLLCFSCCLTYGSCHSVLLPCCHPRIIIHVGSNWLVGSVVSY